MQTCHRRRAHAIGGMAAFIPSRRDRGGESRRASRGCGRTRGARRAEASTAPGWRTPTWSPPSGRSSTRRWGTSPTRRTAGARRCGWSASGCSTSRIPGGRITEAGVRGNVERRPAVPRGLAPRLRGGRDQQHDGGHRDRGDRAGAALAVDPARGPHRGREAGDPGACTRDAGGGAGPAASRPRPPDHGWTMRRTCSTGWWRAKEFPEFLTLEAYQKL